MAYAGALRHRVELLRPAGRTQSDTGAWQGATSEELVGSRWASVAQLSGRELEYARRTYADADYRIGLRGDSLTTEVRPEWVVRWGERRFEVLSANDRDERGFDVTLTCKETK